MDGTSETTGGNDDGHGVAKDAVVRRNNRDTKTRQSAVSHVTFESSDAVIPPCRRAASSEEDSVAEMDYLSKKDSGSKSRIVRQLPSYASTENIAALPTLNQPLAGASPAAAPPPARIGILPRPLTSPALADLAAKAAAQNPPALLPSVHTGSKVISSAAASYATPTSQTTTTTRPANDDDPPDAPGSSVATEQSQEMMIPNDHLLHHHHHRRHDHNNNSNNCEDSSNVPPLELPRFADVQTCMWTASHAANSPCEDRSASLVNVLLQPLPPNYNDSETQLLPLEADYKTLLRLNFWAVVDGHGGGCVATYVSEVLLPHIAASVSRALHCAIVDRGVCTVNGQRRNANALDLDGLIQMTAEQCPGNPNSIHYRSPYERSDSGDEGGDEGVDEGGDEGGPRNPLSSRSRGHHHTGDDDETAVELLRTDRKAPLPPVLMLVSGEEPSLSFPNSITVQPGRLVAEDQTASSVKTSVKTAASPSTREDLVGTHSPAEVAAITRAITESFLAVDEGWINSIDPVATHQTSCHANGRWNSGACALVVFTVQRLDWTSVAEPGRAKEQRDPEQSRLNTSQNRDAARRRMLDYATRTKATTTNTTATTPSASTMSIDSSTSSLTTEETAHASGIESEITETEGEDERTSYRTEHRHRDTDGRTGARGSGTHFRGKRSLASPTGSGYCSSHCYRAHDAIIYTAHVGDCRAVMLGSAPPRTIKVGGYATRSRTRGEADVTDDEESSHHSSDETECLSSSDHEAESSEDEDLDGGTTVQADNGSGAGLPPPLPASEFINLPPRRVVRDKNAKRRAIENAAGPYIALPPLDEDEQRTTGEVSFETDVERRERRRLAGKDTGASDSSTTSQESLDVRPLLLLPPGTRPIDLTTDHSAYNPAEVTAVLRRCNNAPKAISAGMGGGIKRVAGSLAVTRALGDAYLKTPKLSFLPYKKHAPYITARPEVNCRLLDKEGDKVLILATDGVWERASGEDTLRWVRNFYEERRAEAERRSKRANLVERGLSPNEDSGDGGGVHPEGSERDLFEKTEVAEKPYDGEVVNNGSNNNSKKRDASSPMGPNNNNSKRRKRNNPRITNHRVSYNVADVIVRRVLNKVRRSRNISSLQALMSLPPGKVRRSKHDDITASVVDLSAFIS